MARDKSSENVQKPSRCETEVALKGTDLRGETVLRMQIFAENVSHTRSFGGRKSWRSQKTTDACRKQKISSTHPSRDVVFSGQILAKKTPEIISVHDVWEPLNKHFWHHVMR